VAGNRDRQRRIARDKHRRTLEARRARQQQARKRASIVLASVLAAALIAGVTLALLPSGNHKKTTASSAKATPSASASPTSSASTSATTVAEPAHNCTYTAVTADVAKKESLPTSTPDYTASYTATIKTNLGDLKLNLLNSKATCTVNSFVHLAEAGYFDNTQCHRLVTTGIYVLQCGDAYATAATKLTCSSNTKVGTGTPGYEFGSENLKGSTYPAGTLAMANDGPTASGGPSTTNGSQFFIVYKDSTSGLNGTGSAQYTPFATVSSGLNIVQNVAKAGTSCQVTQDGESEGGPPKDKVIINSVSIQST
jgi:peptidyl-prolyl cis-trans isomerase B (cyclophilin B)